MSRYAVVYVNRSTQAIEFVAARGMLYHVADTLAASLKRTAREECYFTVRNERELTDQEG